MKKGIKFFNDFPFLRSMKRSNSTTGRKVVSVLLVLIGILYYILTYKSFWGSGIQVDPKISLFYSIFGSLEMIRMVRALLFYGIPILCSIVILNLIFSEWSSFRIGTSGSFIELNKEIKEALDEKYVKNLAIMKETIDQELSEQLSTIDDFCQIAFAIPSIYPVFSLFHESLIKLFEIKKDHLDYIIFFTDGTYSVYAAGQSFKDISELNKVFNDLNNGKQWAFVKNLNAPIDNLEEDTRIHCLIAATLFFDNKVSGVVGVFSKQSDKIFRLKDARILKNLCRYMGILFDLHHVNLDTYDNTIRWLEGYYSWRLKKS